MRLSIVLVSLCVSAGVLSAQSAQPSPSVTPAALSQIQQARQATTAVASMDSARAAGFSPIFGWIPTMGTHWVSAPRTLSGKNATIDKPSQLMFSPIDGKQTLVGAAYAYLTAANDSTRPSIFDGNPPWHDHQDLAPPGTNLVMLHVWFVPSPDGPFAGHNPFLPFWQSVSRRRIHCACATPP